MKARYYIGVVRTSYHLINVLAFLESHQKKHEYAEIIYSPYWNSSDLSCDLIAYCTAQNIKITNVRANLLNSSLMNRMRWESSNFTIVAVNLNILIMLKIIFFNIIKKVGVVFIDDGIGSYSGFTSRLKAVHREKNKFYFTLLFPFYYYTQKMLGRIIGQKYAMLQMPSWNLNIDYRTAFISLLKKLNTQTTKLDCPSIVFCTQPYIDMKVLSTNEYNNILDLILKLSKESSLELIIRKHPADISFDYSGFNIMNDDSTFEGFLMRNVEKVKKVVSIDSTCLLTASALFDIDSYRVDCSISRYNSKSFTFDLKAIFEKYTKVLRLESYGE